MGATTERIVTAAGALFAEHGFAASSIREIAAAAGVPPAAIYSRFASKQAILAELLERAYRDAVGWVRTTILDRASSSPAEQLEALMKGYIPHLRGQPALSAIVSAELDRLPPDVARGAIVLRDELGRLLAGVIRRGQHLGEFTATDDPFLIVSALRGIAIEFAGDVVANADFASVELREVADRIVGRVRHARGSGRPDANPGR